MRRVLRITIYLLAALALPAAALLLGMRTLRERERPALLAPVDGYALEAIARPALDPARPTVVVLLARDLTEITDALGPYEMFARAGRYNVVTAAPERQPTLLTGGLRILPHYSLAELDALPGGAPAIVVVPNLPNAADPVNRPLLDWIRARHDAGALIHSWCKGAMALAEAGLLDGGTATAHWGDIPKLERRYPRVTWVRGVRWVERDRIVLSAGITSGIDASLRVLIREAGDSVARRVAREIRYPNYRYAIDPRVEQYALAPADLVLLANAAFRFDRPRTGIALYDGVGEFDLSNVYDAHVHTLAVRGETVALEDGPVTTAYGLTLYPSLALDRGDDADAIARLERVIVPGVDARTRAATLTRALAAVAPGLGADYVHVDQPRRFGLAPVIEDLARTADAPTARFALKRMEFRADDVVFAGPALPLAPLTGAAALALLGLALAFGALRPRR